jgi:hypothetical protein
MQCLSVRRRTLFNVGKPVFPQEAGVWFPVDSKSEFNATTCAEHEAPANCRHQSRGFTMAHKYIQTRRAASRERRSLAASAQIKTTIARLQSPRPTNRPL